MKKGFTIVEMAVSVSIIVLLTAALGPALLSGQKQADIDMVSQEVRNGIIDTQSLAFAPQPGPGSPAPYPDMYIFYLNFTSSPVTPYTGIDIPKYSYAIIGKQTTPTPSQYWAARVKTIDALPTYTLATGTPAAYGTNPTFFKINFRVSDGMTGCSGIYYEDQTYWSSLCASGGDYVQIKITVAGKDKYLSINKITGETEL